MLFDNDSQNAGRRDNDQRFQRPFSSSWRRRRCSRPIYRGSTSSWELQWDLLLRDDAWRTGILVVPTSLYWRPSKSLPLAMLQRVWSSATQLTTTSIPLTIQHGHYRSCDPSDEPDWHETLSLYVSQFVLCDAFI